jgi:hypothetical protein
MCGMPLCCYETKLPNLKLKTWPKQLLGSLQLVFVLTGQMEFVSSSNRLQSKLRFVAAEMSLDPIDDCVFSLLI